MGCLGPSCPSVPRAAFSLSDALPCSAAYATLALWPRPAQGVLGCLVEASKEQVSRVKFLPCPLRLPSTSSQWLHRGDE